jgi:hypothetical protein
LEHPRNSLLTHDASNPAATHDLVAVVENCRLPRSDGTLRMVEGDEGFARPMRFDLGRRARVIMANLDVSLDPFAIPDGANPIEVPNHELPVE